MSWLNARPGTGFSSSSPPSSSPPEPLRTSNASSALSVNALRVCGLSARYWCALATAPAPPSTLRR